MFEHGCQLHYQLVSFYLSECRKVFLGSGSTLVSEKSGCYIVCNSARKYVRGSVATFSRCRKTGSRVFQVTRAFRLIDRLPGTGTKGRKLSESIMNSQYEPSHVSEDVHFTGRDGKSCKIFEAT